MHLTALELTDLRCFAGTQSLSLDRTGNGDCAGWTVFAGRNGSGKTTLLKAIAAATVGPLATRSLAPTFPGWVREGASVGRAAVRINVEGDVDKFSGKGGTVTDPFWAGVAWRPNGGGATHLESWLDKDPVGRRKAAERGPWADSPQGWFIAGYGPYRRLGPPTAEVAKLAADPALSRLVNLFNESATLSDAVDWLRGVHLRALENKPGAAKLRDDVIDFLNNGLLPDNSRVLRVDSDGLWVERDATELPLEQVSDGYRTVTALVVDLLRRLHATYGALHVLDVHGLRMCINGGVVLIDEVDAHLHPEWQQKIGFWLREHFPNIQFLVTTHSPFICQAASPNGLIRLPAPGDGRQIAHVEPRVYQAIVRGGADDAVVSELFGLPHAHTVATEAILAETAALEACVLRDDATAEQLARYRALRAQLPDSDGVGVQLLARAAGVTGVR